MNNNPDGSLTDMDVLSACSLVPELRMSSHHGSLTCMSAWASFFLRFEPSVTSSTGSAEKSVKAGTAQNSGFGLVRLCSN